MSTTAIVKQLLRGVRHRRKIDSGVRVLTYHGVVENRVDKRVDESFHLLADFRKHLDVLRRCRVVPLAELDNETTTRRLRPRVAITFDDGFANNLVAAELLASARLPATFFIATEAVERGEPIWPTLLRLILARGSRRRLELAGVVYDLDGDPAAIGAVRKMFKTLAAETRIQRWRELEQHYEPGELAELQASFPAIRMMNWSEVQSLASIGFEVGSHGALHELHHAQQSARTRERELVDSRAQIERELGRPCERFAFPNGAFSDSSPADVRRAGYLAAFTMVSRAAGRTVDPMLIPRIVPGAGIEKIVSSIVFGN